jgi:hypothetical protein
MGSSNLYSDDSVDLRRDAALFIDRITDSLAEPLILDSTIPKDTCYLMIRETPLRNVFKG